MVGGRIILDMPNPALDSDGDPYSKAKLYFYLAGTSTLADVFSDNDLAIPLTNPVISDSAGRFVEVWGDVTVTFDARWTTNNDALIFPFTDIVPIATGGVDADGNGVNAAAFRTALGLGSAALADVGTTGDVLPFLDQSNTFSANQNFTGGIQRGGLDVGYLGVPPNTRDANYVFALTDRGKGVWHTSGSSHVWGLDPNIFSQGDSIYIRNIGAGSVSLTRGVGVALRIAGVSTDADATLASYGAAVITCDAVNVFCVAGVGVT